MAIVLDQRLSEICELATTAAGVARLKFGNRTAVFLSRGASLAAIHPLAWHNIVAFTPRVLG